MKMFRKDEGFTLVELMVVVLIIGILVAIAIPVFNAASASARKSACVSNLRTLNGAVEQWKSADPTHDPGAWADIAAAKAALSVYVKDMVTASRCPLRSGGAANDGAYTITIVAGASGDPGLATFACPNAVSAGHTF